MCKDNIKILGKIVGTDSISAREKETDYVYVGADGSVRPTNKRKVENQ